jgi:hypothetical protein
LTASDPGKPLELVLSAPGVEPETVSVGTDLLPVKRRAEISVDGDSGDWQGAEILRVETGDRIEPPDPAGWRGAEDLSAHASLAWDDDNLYLLVRVVDDAHVPDQSPDLRDGDSLRVAIDIENDASSQSGYDANDVEYGIALDQKKTRIVRTQPRGANDSLRAVGKRSGGSTVYEMAFPWPPLGRAPRSGLVFSLDFAAIENDGSGRKYSLVLSPGIAGNRRPGQFRDFFLKD